MFMVGRLKKKKYAVRIEEGDGATFTFKYH